MYHSPILRAWFPLLLLLLLLLHNFSVANKKYPPPSASLTLISLIRVALHSHFYLSLTLYWKRKEKERRCILRLFISIWCVRTSFITEWAVFDYIAFWAGGVGVCYSRNKKWIFRFIPSSRNCWKFRTSDNLSFVKFGNTSAVLFRLMHWHPLIFVMLFYMNSMIFIHHH